MFQLNHRLFAFEECVVPENIHTPTTEDFLICTPPSPRISRSRVVFDDHPSPQEFPEFFYLKKRKWISYVIVVEFYYNSLNIKVNF